jgi:Transposase IS66 family
MKGVSQQILTESPYAGRPLRTSTRITRVASFTKILCQELWTDPFGEPLTLWTRLTRFLEYPVLELSNNLAENAIPPVALGRRNWIHIGSKDAGPRLAAIVSVVETCRRLKIPAPDYLGSVLPGLGDFPIIRIAELTPAAWATRN